MSSEPLLNYEPLELSFQIERTSQLSSSIRLLNTTDNYAAFKLKSTNPRYYVVRPRIGILLPRSTCEIKVIMRSLREATHNMRCKDKFMIQSAVAAPDTSHEDTRKLFDKEAGHPFQESVLRVVISRATASSPGTSFTENTDLPASEANNSVAESLDNDLQITRSTAELHGNDLLATNVIQPGGSDSKEVNMSHSFEIFLRSITSKCASESILGEVIGSLLFLVLLYLLKRTLSWIKSLVMFVIMLMVKMIKKLVSDSLEDWIVKTLLQLTMYLLFGRNNTVST